MGISFETLDMLKWKSPSLICLINQNCSITVTQDFLSLIVFTAVATLKKMSKTVEERKGPQKFCSDSQIL